MDIFFTINTNIHGKAAVASATAGAGTGAVAAPVAARGWGAAAAAPAGVASVAPSRPHALQYLKCYILLLFILASLDPLIRDISSAINVKVQLEKCISKLYHMGTYVNLESTQATLSVNKGFLENQF